MAQSTLVQSLVFEYGETGYEMAQQHLNEYMALIKKREALEKTHTEALRLEMMKRKELEWMQMSEPAVVQGRDAAGRFINGGPAGAARQNAENAAIYKQQVAQAQNGLAIASVNAEASAKSLKAARAEESAYGDMLEVKKRNLALNRELAASTPVGRIIEQWEKLKTVFRRVFDALASFVIINTVVGALGGFFSSLIQSNSQLEVLDTRLKVMMGTGGGFEQLKRQIIDLTVKTPFLIRDFADASVSLTAFGQSVGKNLGPVSDWATAIGKDLGDITLAFSKIATGSPRTALLLSTRGISKAEFDRTVKETGDRAEALRLIIGRKFGGMAQEVSKTFEGITSNIKDQWFLVAQIIGAPLFDTMKADISVIYNALNSLRTSTLGVGGLKVLGMAIDAVYRLLKTAFFPILAVAGAFVLNKFGMGLAGIGGVLDRMRDKFGAARVSAQLWTAGIAFLLQGFISLKIANDAYNNSIFETAEAYNKFGPGTDSLILALENQRKALEDVGGFWNETFNAIRMYFQTTAIFGQSAGVLAGELWGKDMARREEEAKKLTELIKLNEALRDARENANRAAGFGFDPREVFDLSEAIKSAEGGTQIFTDILKAMKEMSAEREKWKGGMVYSHLDANAQAEGNMKDSIDILSLALGGKRKDFIKKTMDAAYKMGQNIVNNVNKGVWGGGNVDQMMKTYDELVKMLMVVKKVGGKELKDWSQEIAALKKQYAEMLEKDSTLYGAKAKNEELINQLTKERADLIKAGAKDNEVGRAGELAKLILDAQIGKERIRMQIEEKIGSLHQKTDEARRGLEEKLIDLGTKRLEYEYEMTGDINALYKDRENQMSDLGDALRKNDFENQLNQQNLAQAKIRGNEIQIAEAELAGVEITQRKVDLEKKRLEILQAIEKLASRDLGQAIGKSLIDLKKSLNGFYDDLAKTLVGGTSETLSGIFHDMLFGSSKDNSLEISKLRMEMVQNNEEAARAYKNAGIISRRENETNEAYLERIRFATTLNQQNIDQYTFKTKEIEALQKINELENERNTLILDRLRGFGEKIGDKVLDQLAGGITYGLGRWLGFGGEGGYNPGSGTPAQDLGGGLGGNAARFGGPAPMVIQFNNPTIFGEADFNNMVDGAVRRIDGRRSR